MHIFVQGISSKLDIRMSLAKLSESPSEMVWTYPKDTWNFCVRKIVCTFKKLQTSSQDQIVLMAAHCEYTKKHWIVYFKGIHFMACVLYLSKAIIKIIMKCNIHLTLPFNLNAVK